MRSDGRRRGRTVLAAAGFGAALLGASAAGAPAAELRGHGGPVRAIAVTRDGATAITGGFDNNAIIWSLKSATARQVLRFHDSQVNAVAALADGRFASAGQDGRIALWREGADKPEAVLEGHRGPISALAPSPDGAWLASAAWDRTVRLWPLSGGEPRVLEGHSDNVNAVVFLADGTVASGGYDATVRYWPAGFAGAPRIVTLPSPVNGLAVVGERLAVGSADGRVRLLDRDGTVAGEAEISPTPVIALAASPDGRRIAAAGIKGGIAVLDAATLTLQHTLVGPGLPVWSLAFSPDGRTLYSGGSDWLVRSWDMATGEHIGAMISSPADPLAAYEGDRGAAVFRACVACHTFDAAETPRAGPTLAGIFGRKIASVPGYPYSEAFRGMDIVWTPATVAKLFELGPHTYTPGTKMPEQVIASAADREALVRFLAKVTGPY